MSDYRTIIKAKKGPFSLKWGEPVFLIGSCFSENIGKKLESAGFPVLINPFGIQYNPRSIAILLDRILKGADYTEDDLHQHNGLHFSFDTHSDMAQTSMEACLDKLNAAKQKSKDFLQTCPTAIITLGTAWYYTIKNSRRAVANCFKMPSTEFKKQLLNERQADEAIHQGLVRLRMNNSDVNIIYTLSPVRHWKDGVQENAISKAILRLGIDDSCANDRVSYFGAYEIMMDDLRDYRFYKADMFHPNEVAIDYIWENFCQTYFSEKDQVLVNRMLALDKASKHRPRVVDSEEHQNFLKKQIAEVEALQKIKSLPRLEELHEYFSGK